VRAEEDALRTVVLTGGDTHTQSDQKTSVPFNPMLGYPWHDFDKTILEYRLGYPLDLDIEPVELDKRNAVKAVNA
jgi:hypothetical protein